MTRAKKFFAVAITATFILGSIGAPSLVAALSVTNVTVSTTSAEITFDGPVFNESSPSEYTEAGSATTYATDLRNYTLKTGAGLTTRDLSRYSPYGMTTQYISGSNKMRIYGLRHLNLSAEDAWQLSIGEDKIRHASSTTTFVNTYTGNDTVADSNDPIINYIVNSGTGADCDGYPCGKEEEQITITGSNFATGANKVKVYWPGVDYTETTTAISATQITTTIPVSATDKEEVRIINVDTNKYSDSRVISVYDEYYGVLVGTLTLSDEATPVDRVPVRARKSGVYYDNTGESQANGKYAILVYYDEGYYGVYFTTPANCSEAALAAVENKQVTNNSVTDVGTKKFTTAVLSGTVKDPTGSTGLYGLEVQVRNWSWTIEQKAITGTDGSWQVSVPNDQSQQHYEIEANPGWDTYYMDVKNYQRGSTSVDLNQGATNTNVNFNLTTVNVSGTIKTPAGSSSTANPYPDTEVPSADLQLRTPDWSYNEWTNTDSSGNFQFAVSTDKFGSNFVLEIRPPYSGDFSNYSETTIEGLVIGTAAPGYNNPTTGNTNLNLDAKATNSALRFALANVWGVVKCSGSAEEGAFVKLEKEGSWYSTNSDSTGKFTFGGVPVGTYELRIEVPSDSSCSNYSGTATISSTSSNDLGNISLPTPNVTGYIYGPTGTTAQANTNVDVCPYMNPGGCYNTMTNSNGYFSLYVPDGNWEFRANAPWGSIYVSPQTKILIMESGSIFSFDGDTTVTSIVSRLIDPAVNGLKGVVYGPIGSADESNGQSNVGLNLRTANQMHGFEWSQTNDQGRFAFGSVDPGTYDVEIEPWGTSNYSRKLYTITVNSDGSVDVDEDGEADYSNRDITLRLTTPNITGYLYTPVLAAGHTSSTNPTPDTPVQYAWVNLHQEGPMQGPGGWYGANTDETGKFQFGGVKEGTYVLEADAPWGSVYSRTRITGIEITAAMAAGTASLDLETKRLSMPQLRGQIKAPDGTAVQDCWIMVHDNMWMNQSGGNTDSNGYFSVGGLVDGTYQIEINLPWGGIQAYSQPSGLTIVVTNGIGVVKKNEVIQTNNVITLTHPSKTLTGYVFKDTNDNDSYDTGVDTVVANARVEAHRDMGGGHFETYTNSSGQYTLKLTGGSWWVEVRPDWSMTQPDWLYNKPPNRVNFVEDESSESKTQDFEVNVTNSIITGLVKAPTGTAVANAWVDVHSGMMGPGNGQSTDSNGRFTIKVAAGTYELMVHPAWDSNAQDYGSPAPQKVVANADDTTDVGTIYLTNKNAHIKGSITDQAGNAISNVMINAHQVDGMSWAMDFSAQNTGMYDLKVNSGTWYVMIMPMSSDYVYQGAPLKVTVEDSETSNNNDFVLKNADATIKVSVKKADGTRVSDMWGGVWVRDTSVNDMLDFGKPMEDMMTMGGMDMGGGGGGPMGPGMEKGGFTGGGLQNGYTEIKVPAGTYEIGLHAPPGSKYTLGSTATVTIASSATEEVDLTVLTNDATISGYLYVDADENGAYTSGEEVSNLNAFINADKVGGGWAMTNSGSDGSYSLDVCAGQWYIDAWIDPMMSFGASKYQIIAEDVVTTVTAGTPITRNFELKELNSTISGKVTDPDEAGMSSVWIFVDYGSAEMVTDFKGPGGPGVGNFTDINGDYTLNVAPGTYKVGAGIPPWDSRDLMSPDLLEVTISSGNTSSTGNDLAFKSSDATISGEITLNGIKKPGFVRAWSDSGGNAGEPSLDGDYSLKVTSGETWTVMAIAEVSNTLYESTATLTTVAGVNTQNLALTSKNITIPEAKAVTFSADENKTIELSDGFKLEIPSGSIAGSGTITVTVKPEINMGPDAKDKPIGLGYDVTAKVTADGATKEISDFEGTNDVKITFPYNETLIAEAGYAEADITPKYYDDTTNTWEAYKSVVRDATNNQVTVTTNHFTAGSLTGGGLSTAGTSTPGGGDTGTGPGGGGSPGIVGPSNVSVLINFGADRTSSKTVTLTFTAVNATEILISNKADFAGANWQSYKESTYWTLEGGDGEKIVYAKFRDSSYNVSSMVSDTVILEDTVLEKDLVKASDSSAVYLILNGKRHIFPHAAVYHSWGYPVDFSTVKTVSRTELEAYAEGDAVPFRDGSMFRGTAQSLHGKDASAVFFVSDGKLRPVKSGEIYQVLFNDPEWTYVAWVPDDLLSKFEYSLGTMIDSATTHPNGALVKYADSSTIYLISNGQRRAFNSWHSLEINGYHKMPILTIPKTEIYEEAETISAFAEALTTPVIAAAFRE